MQLRGSGRPSRPTYVERVTRRSYLPSFVASRCGSATQRNIIALHFHYGLSQLMLYPVVCARTFQSARCELLVPNQHSPGE